jgi:surfeit locus 1 family protein
VTRGTSVLLATPIVLPMLAVLIGLGVWQLQRLGVKEEIIAQRERAFTAPAVELPAREGNPIDLWWRRVTVTGRFDHANEFHLWSLRDGQPGYDVLTPLVRTDGAPTQVVLVDRGWVPVERKEIATRGAGAVTGEVTVNGFVRIDLDVRSAVTPANSPATNTWYSVDYAAMGRQSGHYLRELVVVADATPNPGGLPVGMAALPPIPNRHLEYALTWFALAGVLVVIFVLALRRQPRRTPAAAA